MQKIMRVISFILFFFNSFIFSQNKSIDNTELYIPLLKDKNIGLVVNQNSVIKDVHLVDSLINLDLNVISIFSPEHGFRLNYGAGEDVKGTNTTKRNRSFFSSIRSIKIKRTACCCEVE